MSSTFYRDLGERVRKLREAHGLSQQEVADKLGYKSRVTISKIEAGEYTVSAEALKQISDIFSIPAGRLLGEEAELQQTKSISYNLQQDDDFDKEDIHAILSYIAFVKDQGKGKQRVEWLLKDKY